MWQTTIFKKTQHFKKAFWLISLFYQIFSFLSFSLSLHLPPVQCSWNWIIGITKCKHLLLNTATCEIQFGYEDIS